MENLQKGLQGHREEARPPATVAVVACRYCGQPIVWTWTGKAFMPVDVRPSDRGTFVLVPRDNGRSPQSEYVGKDSGKEAHESHFATCPKADVARDHAKLRRRQNR